MVDAVARELRTIGEEWRLIIVDDSSPDGTGEVADALAETRPWLVVAHRPQKRGIGPAILAGLDAARRDGASRILTMDCDFSHQPADVPRLLAAARNADLVIGSRYVAGGGIQRWGLARRTISRGGCRYARLILGSRIRDLTSGFRCYDETAINQLRLETVNSRGYAFQVEVATRVEQAGLRVVEVPIVFDERRAGGSKLSHAIVFEAAWRIPSIRLGRRGTGFHDGSP